MLSDNNTCGSKLLLALPDDIFAVVTRSLTPRDVFNLSVCCRSLYALASSDKVWLTQCELLGIIPHRDLIEWRKGVVSYKALCRFLVNIEPLIGIWVHQNPELGNVVYVMPGFISVVGCRVIPQELGPLGMEEGPILWSPVFEILGDFDGSSAFLLHGRERENNYMYPGSVKGVDRNCNVLLLEVEPRQQRNGGKLVHSKSFIGSPLDKDFSRKICPSDRGVSKSQRLSGQKSSSVPFSRLAFGDRRKLIEIVTSQIRVKVAQSADGLSFPSSKTEDLNQLSERRSRLMQMLYKRGSNSGPDDWKVDRELSTDPTQSDLSEIRKFLDKSSGSIRSQLQHHRIQCSKKKSLVGYFRDSFKQMIGKSSHEHSSSENNKYAQFQEFLRSGDTIGLTLHASTARLSCYRAWPNMHDSRFALYKLPKQEALPGQEHAGLWGGTFGWPPGRPSADKPGKALFFLLLSYEESQGQRLLIGTKILEGTHYVLHPNGSAMFIVNIDEPSVEPFPWDSDGDSNILDLKEAFVGEGIANGYGFRYPGSKPGSLFVFEDGMLVFMWKESRAVLTLQRVNLQHLLKKGERVPPLPPIANFSYLTKSYSNVYAGFSNHASSSPRSGRS